ncbi:MAG: FAD-binding domain-containing protein [Halalkalicoccus sp.]
MARGPRRLRARIPFVDANVREPNRDGIHDENVASFLAKSLRIDWRRGAAYFETRLVDYDPCSNYGNWAYVAGVGNDSRDSYFDVVGQAKRYDPDAEYVRTWLPELSSLPAEAAHEPWEASEKLLAAYDLVLGEEYPGR